MARLPRSICRAKVQAMMAARGRGQQQGSSGTSSGAGAAAAAGRDRTTAPPRLRLWLRTLPAMGHTPEDYGDAPDEHGVPPAAYQALERHLPRRLRSAPRERKLAVMRRVLQGLYPLRPLHMNLFYRQYRESFSSYQPLHREIYNMNPSTFFVPQFLQAMTSNNEASFRSIMVEPAPGLFVFPMLEPAFCQMLKAEVDHFQHYLRNQRMMTTTTIGQNNYGVDLSDFGLETMLDNLMKDFLSPLVTVLYPELGASSLDSHQSFVTSFAAHKGEGLHTDDSEVTLNVCINEEYIGGNMYFCGVRCVDHMNTFEPRNKFLVIFGDENPPRKTRIVFSEHSPHWANMLALALGDDGTRKKQSGASRSRWQKKGLGDFRSEPPASHTPDDPEVPLILFSNKINKDH